jgi:hypothetical protein
MSTSETTNDGKMLIFDAKFPLVNTNYTCNINMQEAKIICNGKNNNGDVMATYELTNIPGPGPEMKYEIKVIPSNALLTQSNPQNSTQSNIVIQKVNVAVPDADSLKCNNGDKEINSNFDATGKKWLITCQRPDGVEIDYYIDNSMDNFTSNVNKFILSPLLCYHNPNYIHLHRQFHLYPVLRRLEFYHSYLARKASILTIYCPCRSPST